MFSGQWEFDKIGELAMSAGRAASFSGKTSSGNNFTLLLPLLPCRYPASVICNQRTWPAAENDCGQPSLTDG